MQLFPEDEPGRRLHDSDDIHGYLLINSRDDRENDVGDPVGDVYIFNTEDAKVESIVEVGPRAVHSYGVHNRYVCAGNGASHDCALRHNVLWHSILT